MLQELGVTSLALPVPFVDAGGPVNVYAIEEADGGVCLFDSGIGSDAGQAALEAALTQVGISVGDVRRIVLSHGHVDHFGNAQWLAEKSGATVFIHDADWEKVVGEERWEVLRPVYAAYFEKLGVPPTGIEHLAMLRAASRFFGRRVEPARAQRLEAGTRLRFKRFEAEVLHLPGHTPGLVCLWAPEQRVLFADDHVLARISPNPLLDLDERGEEGKFRALEAYLRSARRVADMDVDWVLPGHGAPFQGHRDVLLGLFGFYEKRQEKMLEHLRAQPSTAYELIPVVFGRLDPSKLFLKLSEVVGNLEVLESQGRLVRRDEDGTTRFAAVA